MELETYHLFPVNYRTYVCMYVCIYVPYVASCWFLVFLGSPLGKGGWRFELSQLGVPTYPRQFLYASSSQLRSFNEGVDSLCKSKDKKVILSKSFKYCFMARCRPTPRLSL